METDQERRKFFAVAAKFSTVAVTLGLGGSAVLATSAEAAKSNPLQLLLHEAVKAGDMRIAFKKFGKQCNLNKDQIKAMHSLTKNDLLVLKQIQKKLSPLGDQLSSLTIVR